MQLLSAGGEAVTPAGRAFVRWIVLAAALVALASGCAALRPVTTSTAEYGAFRKARISPTLEGRIVAAARYLAQYPDGTFATEVRAFYTMAEPLYFEEHRGTAAGLHVYLAALPRGPHAAEARQRLERLAEKGPSAEGGFDRAVMGTNARLARLAGMRSAAREQMMTSLRVWLDPDAFARPMVEAKAELLVPWSLSLPWPRCTWNDEARGGEMRCEKLFELPYEVTKGEGTEERQATVEVVIVEDARGRPRRVTIGGPDLFVRLEETFTGRAIDLGDPSGRAAGVSRATELVRREFSARISDDPACRKRTRAPKVLELACGGVRVVVEAALDSTEDDRIVITPMTSD
ncbi:hypothetical protein [Polyangium fumosum]|uniref:Uncharacterized protein n=1 Tax=Polyangium fumosum TaxID=889272 RepID=A0A4U1IV70_9BACT|nr:hypothetical protein [Polyangium fumosum]TKC98376.1 hypothetical protein E8A74_41525 [Polyangium fumosum]